MTVTTRLWGFSCYSCRASFNGEYDGTTASENTIEDAAGKAGWCLGVDGSGQGHYACPNCAPGLFSPRRLKAWR